MNPFESVLTGAAATLRTIAPMPEVHEDSSLIPKFVALAEERAFMFDIVDRIELLADCFDRLRVLGELYRNVKRSIDQAMADQKRNYPERVKFDVPDELIKKREDCHAEAMLLVSFAYYEMSALVGLRCVNSSDQVKARTLSI